MRAPPPQWVSHLYFRYTTCKKVRDPLCDTISKRYCVIPGGISDGSLICRSSVLAHPEQPEAKQMPNYHTTEGQRSLYGTVPVGSRRLPCLFAVCLHRNLLQGPAMGFSATLNVLALHENMLSEVPAAPLTLAHPQAIEYLFQTGLKCPSSICLHRNILSCQLPSIRGSSINMSWVAIGNHLQYPEDGFPEWIQPHERSALFYISRNEGAQLLLQMGIVTSLACLAAVRHLVRSRHELLGRHRRAVLCVATLMASTIRTCWLLTIFSCSLPLRLCFASPNIRCPSLYVWSSSLFSTSGFARWMVILSWTWTSTAFAWCTVVDPS